jgi:hypothetical protein
MVFFYSPFFHITNSKIQALFELNSQKKKFPKVKPRMFPPSAYATQLQHKQPKTTTTTTHATQG